MVNDCTNCANMSYDHDFDTKKCGCHNRPIKDVDKYIDCVCYIPKNKEVGK